MNESELCRALRAYIEEAVKDLQLPVEPPMPDIDADDFPEDGEEVRPKEPTPTEEYVLRRTPTVINGYLPPKRDDEDDKRDFPCIVVRPDESTSSRELTTVTVSIIFCAYSQTSDGYEHCLNMATRVRTAIMSLPFLTLANRYRLEGEVSWRNFSEQPHPYYQIDMSTKWTFQSPLPVSGIEDL